MLYTDDIIPMKNRDNPKLGYKLDVPQNYEYYKNKQQEKAKPQDDRA